MKVDHYILSAPDAPFKSTVYLPASKSVSNRVLIIRALCKNGFKIENLSLAEDTQILNELLKKSEFEEYCGAGGTTVRFLLALRCLQSKEGKITGSHRLKERPVRELVDKLRELGASIHYVEKEGFLPLGLGKSELHGGRIDVRSDISSQFVSSLLLIAPGLNEPLTLHLTGDLVSVPYIEMTLALMKLFGAHVQLTERTITVFPVPYAANDFTVPADWSAAAFFYAMAALRPGSEIRFRNLSADQFQGDRILRELMRDFGVESSDSGPDIIVCSKGIPDTAFRYDFTNMPDLAQAFAVMAAVSNRPLILTGLSTLKHKETNRLLAMKQELEKAGAVVTITDDSLQVVKGVQPDKISGTSFHTYQDHRMVMALSLLTLCAPAVCIEDPGQVSKSFPGFFNELQRVGYIVK